jgi:hypothetical protein
MFKISNFYLILDYLSKIGGFLKSLIRFRNDETALKILLSTIKPWNQWKLAISK